VVHIERRGSAAHVTLNNVHCLNAEDLPLLEDLETAVDLVLLDDGVRVGVLRGGTMTHPKYLGRRVFCSGINLVALYNGEIPLVEFLIAREMGLIAKLRTGVLVDDVRRASHGFEREVQKPWVAAVDSFAIGGGMQLLLAMDVVVAEQDAYFSLPAAD